MFAPGTRSIGPSPRPNFRGRFRDWPVFFDNFLREHQVTDILLFGDCRPYHVSARRIAALRGVRTYVLEEGYLRPHWMTLELDGVNGYSRLARNKDWILEQARSLPPEPFLPPITASFQRRVRDTARHYIAVHLTGRFTYPHYRTHRAGSALKEAIGWGWKYCLRGQKARQTPERSRPAQRQALFSVPAPALRRLPDPQPFTVSRHALGRGLCDGKLRASCADDAHLLVKAHPFDTSLIKWPRFIRQHARRLGIPERVHFIDGGNLEQLAAKTAGMVCVNSTSATLALAAGRPVCALGEAIYNLPGLTFRGHVDEFWTDPEPPEQGLYGAFRRILVDRCLVRGGVASKSAVQTLIDSIVRRLFDDEPRHAVIVEKSALAK